MAKVAQYGSWKSPITAELYASSYIGVDEPMLDDGYIFWNEFRPKEAGRHVIVRRSPDGQRIDVTPKDFYARTTVHEYGGGTYVVHNGTVYFSNFKDQRLYRQPVGAQPEPITPASVDIRYADGVFDTKRNRLIIVREDHTAKAPQAVNSIVAVNLDKENPGQILVSGADFYSNPRISPDGSRLAWLVWNHPNMPWDGTELFTAGLNADGSLGARDLVAGGLDESIFQPEWSPDGALYFVSDRTGWWNLYRWKNGTAEPVHLMKAEFGQPQWVFRERSYAFESPNMIVCSYIEKGTSQLARLDTNTGRMEQIPVPYTNIYTVITGPGVALILAGSPSTPASLVQINLETHELQVIRRVREETIDPGYISTPETIEFPTENGLTAYAFYYPPKNKDYVAPSGEKPPLLVMSHGGPTGSTGTTLRYGIQFWTSHGVAIVDVEYGGSTGYGRDYRERLKDNWGIVELMIALMRPAILSRGETLTATV